MSLRDLDARLVPRLAALLRSFLDTVGGRRSAAADSARRRSQKLVDPSSSSLLRRLDKRYASSGPLKLLRDVPQLGLLLVATVFLAAAGVALALNEPEVVRERQQAEQEAALPLRLGPAVGAPIDPHFEAARERAVDLSRQDPDARFLALVSLNKGLTPEEAGALVAESGLEVQRAYLRAPVAGEPEQIVFQTPGEVADGLRQVFAQISARKAKEQQDLLGQAASIEAGTAEEKEFRTQFEADARIAGEEAAAYRSGCACVFALVVSGQAGELAELPALPVVRGVEIAPRGVELAALEIRPLAPAEQGVVQPPASSVPSPGP